MKGIIIKVKAFIKRKLGLCNTNGLHEKDISEIETDCINDKRYLLKLGMEDTASLAKALSTVGIKATDIKNNGEIKVKSKEKKQLESLYKLLNKVKKNRVKKKIRNRINKVKRKVENNKNRS